MHEYDVSVIIPVYNCENYVKECIDSIINQDYANMNKVQVIIVDDGSTDNSLAICKELQKNTSNLTIDIIEGENSGVSSARNKGIQAAKGKYMMFIDADDFISENAIRELVIFFDEHYDEVDIVSYPLYQYDMSIEHNIKDSTISQRYLKMDTTKIYDLKKDYWAVQPTMNVVIKNLYSNNILFDTNVNFHEDILYNTEIIAKKFKIGYISTIKYYYRIYGKSTSDNRENPLYSFEQFMYVAEKLFNTYKDENGCVEQYVQRIILNVIRWRILKRKLLPYYLDGEEWDKAYSRFVKLLTHIDNKNIMQYNLMDKYHKMFLLNMKNTQFNIYTDHKGTYSINDSNDDIIDVVKDISVVVNKFKVKNEKIKILAYLKSTILYFKKPKLYIEYTTFDNVKVEEEIKLKSSVASYYKSNIKVANFYMFEYEVDMKKIKKFEFKTYIDCQNIKVKYYFNKFAQISPKIKATKVYSKDYRVQFKKNKFFITKPDRKTKFKDCIRSIKIYNKINKKINFYRLLSRKNKKYWIYNDRIGVFDNAYIQFRHDIQIKDGIKRYYILDGNKKECKNKFTKKELKHVVKFGSLKHKILYLNADKLLTSFQAFQEYCPFFHTYMYYKDLLKYDLIYLQHGILHANTFWIYSKTISPIDKIVISSNFEKENFINNYEYSEKDLLEVGMPRLDTNSKNVTTKPENKIIFAPSWRDYLMGHLINRRRAINVEKFEKSNYYIEIIKFLQNEKLNKVLKEKNIILDFKLHPIFEVYKPSFDKIISENIAVSIGNTDLSRYKAFITDFSSFQFDFVKLQRPIVYFVPDMLEFKAGLHTYRELDLKYEDAFGKLFLKGEELVDEVINLINNDFKVEPLYAKRMSEFFLDVKNGKDKLYKALKDED